MLVSGWHRLGDQSPQVTFTALFAFLLGGHQPFAYITHRMIDVGIGVATADPDCGLQAWPRHDRQLTVGR